VRAVESGWSLRSSMGALPIYSTAAYGIRQVSPCPLLRRSWGISGLNADITRST